MLDRPLIFVGHEYDKDHITIEPALRGAQFRELQERLHPATVRLESKFSLLTFEGIETDEEIDDKVRVVLSVVGGEAIFGSFGYFSDFPLNGKKQDAEAILKEMPLIN